MTIKPFSLFKPITAVAIIFSVSAQFVAAESVIELGLQAEADIDNTENLQQILNTGPTELEFPAGTYYIGSVTIPEGRTLKFSKDALIRPVVEKINDKNLFIVDGDDVRIEGIYYDFAWNGAGMKETPVHNLIYAYGVKHVTVSQANVKNSDERKLIPLEQRARKGRFYNFNGYTPMEKYSHVGYYNSQVIFRAIESEHLTLEDSVGSRLHGMMEADLCSDVVVRGNRMVSGNYMTRFSEGGESLRHYDNWSRDVKYQAVWFGGSPDPSRKKNLPRGSATVVYRDIKAGDPGYNKHTSGAYDVLIQNNYAEYGNTLCWGNKGRQVVIDGNIARFIADYAYGSEGGENLIFSNNIAINCTAGGIASMYWGEKLLITGNQVIIRHEPWDPEFSWWDDPSKYLGPFVRLHHGPSNPEDRYGAGSVQISDNLFVNELTTRTVQLSVQAGRDVLIGGNKFINGAINKFGEGRLTVMDNEFISRMEFDPATVFVKPMGTSMTIVKGNIFRKEPAVDTGTEEEKRSEANKVPYFAFTGDDQAGMESEEAAMEGDAAAITLTTNVPFFGLVEDNFIYGWKEAFYGMVRRNVDESTMIVQKNTTDGKIHVNDESQKAKLKLDGNMELPKGLMK